MKRNLLLASFSLRNWFMELARQAPSQTAQSFGRFRRPPGAAIFFFNSHYYH
jgi:hypothetical protein